MTSTAEFTYLYNGFSLSIKETDLTRAVRVKNAVKDKIKRIFKTKQNVVANDNVSVQPEVKESLVDLNQDKFIELNNAINVLGTQPNVSYTPNRAVLFTQPLVAKIFRVTNKWFDGMPRIEKQTVSNDIPSVDMINHLGGEVVPGSWNQLVENEVTQENTLPLEPTLEAVPEVNTDEVPTTNIEIPTSLGNTDVYSFNFDMDNILPPVEPVVNTPVMEAPIVQSNEENNMSFDFVPEPRQIDNTNENNLVSEQTVEINDNVVPSFENNDFGFNLPNLEPVVNKEVSSLPVNEEVPTVEQVNTPVSTTTHEMEDKINELLNTKFTPNPANNFVPEHVDNRPAEEKIDDLLGRTTMVKETTPEVSAPVMEAAPVEEPVVNQVREDKPEITQSQILARLKRVSNTMADKDATIKSLTSKNDALREENTANKEKIAEYETRVSDLTAKNSDLISQNERLTAKVEESESTNKSTIARLESKLEEVTQSKSEEIESLKKMVEELKERHAAELSSMKEKHANELRLVNESKDKQIQAIYSTITDALGDTTLEGDYSKGMAA